MPVITDDQLRALFGQHCECRPLDLSRAGDDHASIHDCDTGILFDIQVALGLWYSTPEVRAACRDRCAARCEEHLAAEIAAGARARSTLPRDPDPRGPCGQKDCARCYPSQRWFRVSTDTVERRRHERKLQATSLEEARAEYDGGPSDYDSQVLETLETAETVVEEIPNPWIHKRPDGTMIDVSGCWWDLPSMEAAP